MLDGLKRLFAAGADVAHPWGAVATWATSRGSAFHALPDDAGFFVEGRVDGVLWRLEWGPSQRPYVIGGELRLRAEPGMPVDVQMLVLDRPLQATLERQLFDQYVESVQTRIDEQSPPEMRWLVLFQKIANKDMGPLRDRFVAVASHESWLLDWLRGDVTESLRGAPLCAGQPLVLMANGARMTLRTALAAPAPAVLDAWLAVFAAAMRAARALGPVIAGEATDAAGGDSAIGADDAREH